MQEDELDTFINQILEEKNVTGLTDQVRETLVEDLKDRLLEQVNQAIIEALPEGKIDEMNALLDDESTSDQQLQSFIETSGVDVNKVTTKTMLSFAELYLGKPQGGR